MSRGSAAWIPSCELLFKSLRARDAPRDSNGDKRICAHSCRRGRQQASQQIVDSTNRTDDPTSEARRAGLRGAAGIALRAQSRAQQNVSRGSLSVEKRAAAGPYSPPSCSSGAASCAWAVLAALPRWSFTRTSRRSSRKRRPAQKRARQRGGGCAATRRPPPSVTARPPSSALRSTTVSAPAEQSPVEECRATPHRTELHEQRRSHERTPNPQHAQRWMPDDSRTERIH